MSWYSSELCYYPVHTGRARHFCAPLTLSREAGLYLDLRTKLLCLVSMYQKYEVPDRETVTRLTSTMNDRAISRLYGCDSRVVARWRDIYGIPRSPKQWGGNTIRWQTNRDYFAEIDTPAKAYILGFVIADGHLSKKGLEIMVKESDADLLSAIAAETGCDAPLRTMTNSYDGSRMKRIALYGVKIVSDLNKLGVFHDKSTTATYPAIDPALESHLVRGIWDGDGYIGPRMFELIGTSALLDGVVAAVQRHTDCLLRRRMSGRNRAYHYAYGSRRDGPALKWMYSGATLALPRKQEKASSEYWSWSQIPRA